MNWKIVATVGNMIDNIQDAVFRNVYYEKSKADDVQFILDLIAKVGAEIPQADMDNVNIAGDLVTAAAWVVIIIDLQAAATVQRSPTSS